MFNKTIEVLLIISLSQNTARIIILEQFYFFPEEMSVEVVGVSEIVGYVGSEYEEQYIVFLKSLAMVDDLDTSVAEVGSIVYCVYCSLSSEYYCMEISIILWITKWII